jgi:predicted YcjX-like family ATPase
LASLRSITDSALIGLDDLADRARSITQPTLRLGVTGLSRAGKTVFITSLVHNLLNRGRLPVFDAIRSGRITSIRLEPQPDDAIPRFQYEDHVDALIRDRIWPDSTRAISELRVTIDYESAGGWTKYFSRGSVSIDIVDYPGEWLLDLPLLDMDYATFSAQAQTLASQPIRHELAAQWLALSAVSDKNAPADEMTARRLAESYAAYLRACKADERSLSTLPPGRFLLPGDLEGSPALTFAPLPDLGSEPAIKGSLHAMMERRFEAYKSVVIKPFFRDHFARLDRQIVLIDALQAVNRGPEALNDLEYALGAVLSCFRAGTNGFLSSLLGRKIDKVLIASTKADHLHHESHDRLEALTRKLVDRAITRIGMTGAGVDVIALSSVRATKEASVRENGENLPVIVGTPIAGEMINGEVFDGNRVTAIFPGDLPSDPKAVFAAKSGDEPLINIVRFRPPLVDESSGNKVTFPHIRLDRALQFLIGDRLA